MTDILFHIIMGTLFMIAGASCWAYAAYVCNQETLDKIRADGRKQAIEVLGESVVNDNPRLFGGYMSEGGEMTDDLQKRAEAYVLSLRESDWEFEGRKISLEVAYVAGAMAERELIAQKAMEPKLVECPKCGKMGKAYAHEDLYFCEYCNQYHGYRVKL